MHFRLTSTRLSSYSASKRERVCECVPINALLILNIIKLKNVCMHAYIYIYMVHYTSANAEVEKSIAFFQKELCQIACVRQTFTAVE